MKTVLIIISLCFLYCTITLSFREPDPEISPYYNPKYDTTKIFFSDSAVNTLFVAQSALKTENKGVFEGYIERFKHVALAEQKKYGIPASITLAQGILESNAGRSKMAIKEKNHFGIKCKRKCTDCRCANYADDSPKDMFRVFGSAWESYREHSLILMQNRYKSCFKSRDYKHWAKELQRCGYATSKKYAQNLISIIEKYKLNKYDK